MNTTKITFQDILANEELRIYVEKGDELLGVLGYTDHSSAHTLKVAEAAVTMLAALGYSAEECDLARIAGYLHDIGNMVTRVDHAQTGAIMVFQILTRMNMPPQDIATIVSAIGNHDEGAGAAISPVSAAIIIADKSDVRRSRVRNKDFATFDIHDRVGYAVIENNLSVDADTREIVLSMTIDPNVCSVMDYFDLFLARMQMCRRAAAMLNATFGLIINGTRIL